MTNKEAISVLKSSLNEHQYVFEHMWTNEQMKKAVELAIKALEFQYQMQFGRCDYCKHKSYDSIKYPCCVCGSDEIRGYSEMWEEADNEQIQ